MPAVVCLMILALIVALYVTRIIPGAVTAVLGCLLLALSGVCTPAEAFSGFASPTVILVVGMMALGTAMTETGVADLLGRRIAALSGRRERLFILTAGTTAALLSMFLSNTAVIAVFLPVITSVSVADARMKRIDLTLPVTMGAMFGGTSTLIGSTPQLTAQGLLYAQTGTELGTFAYTLPGLVLFAVYMLYALFVGYPMGKRIWGGRAAEAEAVLEPEPDDERPPCASRTKMILFGVIFLAVIVCLIGGWIDASLAAVSAAVLCVITGCTSFGSVMKHMNWSAVFVLAGCLSLAGGIAQSGADVLLGKAFSDLLSPQMPPLAVFAMIVPVTMLVSNFVTNSTAVILLLPPVLSLCTVRGLNPALFTLGIVFAANLSFSTPLANAQTSMTLTAGYRFSDYIRYTWLLDAAVCAVIVLVFPLLVPLYL